MHALRTPVIFLAIEAALNLSLSIWLARRLGIAGVALATLLPTLLTTVALPMKLCRELKISVLTFVRAAVFPSLVLLLVGVPLNLALDRLGTPFSYAALVLRGAANVCLAVGLAAVVLPADDVAALRTLFRRRRTT
jgi:peptidoglycan biosynthesis protein MviN/MurJ (putative lipid II flippase)